MEKCPKCGSRDRHITVTDTIRTLEMVGVKQKAKGYRKFKKYIKQGEKISKSGKLARQILIIDKEELIGLWKKLFKEIREDSNFSSSGDKTCSISDIILTHIQKNILYFL